MKDAELIVKTELDAPQIRGKILRRERLLNILRKNLDKKLTIICADAGYGKTTLLAQFCEEIKNPFVFYDLDAQDSDVSTFFHHLIAGVKKHAPAFGERVGVVLAERRSSETITGTFINEFIERVKDDFFFIFDDYHRVGKDRKIAKIIDYFLRHLPGNLHFVISSRTTPPIYLSYYLAKQELLHLDKEHLQFDMQETQVLLNEICGLEVHEEEINRIAELSEGWVTVIQLILQKISATPEVKARETLNSYLASGEDVFEYFAREVFNDQSRVVREFLTKTSILEYLNPEICECVTGMQGSGEIITHLETEHIFVLRSGENLLYHPLFQEFLYRRLTDTRPAREIKKLHDSASDYFWGLKEYSSAVHHLLSGGRYGQAAKILEKHCEYWSSSGEYADFVRLAEKLPESFTEKHPHLLLKKGSMYFELAQVEKGLVDVDKALRRMRKTGDRKGMVKAYALKWDGSTMLMQSGKALYYIKKAYAFVGERRSRDKVRIMINLGTAYRIAGKFRKAQKVLHEALGMARAMKDDALECSALQKLGMLYYNMSELRMAEKTFTEIVARFHDQIYPLELAYTYRIIASIAVDNGDAVRARHYIERSEVIAQQYSERYLDNYLVLLKGRVQYLQGDYDRAIELFRRVVEQNRDGDIKITDLYALQDSVEVYLKVGDVRRARAALDQAESVLHQSKDVPQHVIGFLIAKGRVETAEGALKAAQASFDAARQMSKKVYDPSQVIALYYALSEHSLACGNIVQAFDFFKKCLDLASQYGFETFLALQGRKDLRFFKMALEMEYMPDFVLTVVNLIDTDEAQEMMQRINMEHGKFDLECRYLGSLQIRDSHGRVFTPRWRTSRTRAIFVLLTVNYPKGCSKEMLVEMCWPRKVLDQAVRSLQVEMSSLRKLLYRMADSRFDADSLIVYRDHHYFLNPRFYLKRDISQFEKSVHEALAKECTDHRKCMQLCNEALVLYRGDFCEEISEDWCANMRAYYREMVLNILKKLAKYTYDEGDVKKALSLYQKAQRFDKYDEALHVGIMRCMAFLKDSDGIQRQYRILTKTLKELDTAALPPEATEIYEESLK
jgi:LuxR family maltose regulon positive regulatory protein